MKESVKLNRRDFIQALAGSSLLLLYPDLISLSCGKTVVEATPGDLQSVGPILLGRPTDKSITINALTAKDLELTLEYGLKSGNYVSKTDIIKTESGHPTVIVLSQLQQDTQYYYRMLYRLPGGSEFSAAEEHTFHTQRRAGSGFTFTVQADSHLDRNSDSELYKRTLLNQLNDNPDFVIDLGDTFMSEKVTNTQEGVIDRYALQRTYFGLLCHSVPLFLANGNHDGELGWLLNGTSANIAVWATEARKMYFLNPAPDSFYAGDSVAQDFVGLREDYYAWEWGNALFIVLDPFWYTRTNQNSKSDSWGWTIGKEQYQWFTRILESSRAQYKFVFAHHVRGTVRAGVEAAPYYEWGGNNRDGSWGFQDNRPGWNLPIHQLMVKNGVTIFFQGHDHFFAKQELDGVIYQTVPQPSTRGDKDHAAEYGYVNGVFLPSSGHLRVRVSGSDVTVDYIRACLPSDEQGNQKNGISAYSYTVNASEVSSTNQTRTSPSTTETGSQIASATTTLPQIPTNQGLATITVTDTNANASSTTTFGAQSSLGFLPESILAALGAATVGVALIERRRRKRQHE